MLNTELLVKTVYMKTVYMKTVGVKLVDSLIALVDSMDGNLWKSTHGIAGFLRRMFPNFISQNTGTARAGHTVSQSLVSLNIHLGPKNRLRNQADTGEVNRSSLATGASCCDE